MEETLKQCYFCKKWYSLESLTAVQLKEKPTQLLRLGRYICPKCKRKLKKGLKEATK